MGRKSVRNTNTNALSLHLLRTFQDTDVNDKRLVFNDEDIANDNLVRISKAPKTESNFQRELRDFERRSPNIKLSFWPKKKKSKE